MVGGEARRRWPRRQQAVHTRGIQRRSRSHKPAAYAAAQRVAAPSASHAASRSAARGQHSDRRQAAGYRHGRQCGDNGTSRAARRHNVAARCCEPVGIGDVARRHHHRRVHRTATAKMAVRHTGVGKAGEHSALRCAGRNRATYASLLNARFDSEETIVYLRSFFSASFHHATFMVLVCHLMAACYVHHLPAVRVPPAAFVTRSEQMRLRLEYRHLNERLTTGRSSSITRFSSYQT